MSPLTVGIIGICLMLFFMACRMSIGLAMALVGFLGYAYLRGLGPALDMVGMVPYRQAAAYTMSVLPLFVVMGNFMFYSGVSRDLYFAAHRWLGHLPGGLAMATTAGCAGFAAVCGSSVATAITIGTVAWPEMQRYNYDPRLATGSIAAGGTLGILIPPSIGFIFYSMLTDESIGKLFIAGILPGILLTVLFILAIYVSCRRNPHLGPQAPSTSFREKLASFRNIWAAVILFLLVMGGLYLGVFTPTETAGIGAFVAFLIMLGKRKLTRANLVGSLLDTGEMVAMGFIILMGATIFGFFMALTRLPNELADLAATLPLPPLLILIAILIIYLFLGCVMDAIAMIILTVPIFYPVVIALGFDPVWFGVMMVIMMEMALITPPVGMNVFVISGATKVPMYTVFAGIFPFALAMIVCIVILIAFPQIALFLPKFMS